MLLELQIEFSTTVSCQRLQTSTKKNQRILKALIGLGWLGMPDLSDSEDLCFCSDYNSTFWSSFRKRQLIYFVFEKVIQTHGIKVQIVQMANSAKNMSYPLLSYSLPLRRKPLSL